MLPYCAVHDNKWQQLWVDAKLVAQDVELCIDLAPLNMSIIT
jgi:hypothetical protein